MSSPPSPRKKLTLNQSIADLKSPVSRSDRPPSADGSPSVDNDKLITLVEALLGLMRDTIETVEQTNASNAETTADNEMTRKAVKEMKESAKFTRKVMCASMVVMLISLGLIANWSMETLKTAQAAKTLLSATLNATSLEQEARVANEKAQISFDSDALEEAKAKTIKAEAAIAMVQQVAAPTPAVREVATKKLKAVKKRAKAMKVKLDEPHPLGDRH